MVLGCIFTLQEKLKIQNLETNSLTIKKVNETTGLRRILLVGTVLKIKNLVGEGLYFYYTSYNS
jgi:hypothetical protein